jgi:hypothetical protein
VHSPDETPTQKQAARRKLVRGVFAAPALMTVCSGSAWATGSSLRCLNRHVTDGTSVAPKVGDMDAWARIQLHRATDGLYYVSGTHVASVYNTSTSVYPATGHWLRVDVTTGAVPSTGFCSTATPGTSAPSGATLGYTSPKYVVVRFDTAGNVKGIGTAGTGANVGASCWNSFKALV